MNYLSPFHILPKGFEAKGLIDKKTLKQARKVVLAEFELQGKATIFINEQEYDKDGILKFFETLEQDTNIAFHVIIFKNKSLLNFLEKGNIKSYSAAVDFIQTESNTENFIRFIASYFCNQYNELLFNALRNNNNDDLFILLEKSFPLEKQDEAAAYQSSYRWYHQKLRAIETIEKQLEGGEFVPSSQVHELIAPTFIHNFNQMPMYFFDIRDKFAFKLYEIVVLLNNKYQRTELARSVLDVGILLTAEERTHQYFVAAEKIIAPNKKNKGVFNWIWLFIIVQVLLVFGKIATCNNTSNSSSYEPVWEKVPQDLYLSPKDDSIFQPILKDYSEDIRRLDSVLQEYKKLKTE